MAKLENFNMFSKERSYASQLVSVKGIDIYIYIYIYICTCRKRTSKDTRVCIAIRV